MDLVEPFNREFADQLYYFLKRNQKNNFFRFGITKKCSIGTFRNYYTQEIINSEFANSPLTNNEKVVFFPASENHDVFGLFLVTLYLNKIKNNQAYIEILFDKEHHNTELMEDALRDLIEYLKDNYNLKSGELFFMVDKKDLIVQKAILNNGGIIYNTMKNRCYMKIILKTK